LRKKRLGQETTLEETFTLSFVIPSEAEGSAVSLFPVTTQNKSNSTLRW
jgi:hypothetical protein